MALRKRCSLRRYDSPTREASASARPRSWPARAPARTAATRTTRPPARSRKSTAAPSTSERGGDSKSTASGGHRHRCRDSRRTPAARPGAPRGAGWSRTARCRRRSRHGCGTRSGSGAWRSSLPSASAGGSARTPSRAGTRGARRRWPAAVATGTPARTTASPAAPATAPGPSPGRSARSCASRRLRRRIASPPAGADRRTCRSRSRPGSPASPAPGTGSARTRRGSRPDTARTGLRRVRAAGSGTRAIAPTEDRCEPEPDDRRELLFDAQAAVVLLHCSALGQSTDANRGHAATQDQVVIAHAPADPFDHLGARPSNSSLRGVHFAFAPRLRVIEHRGEGQQQHDHGQRITGRSHAGPAGPAAVVALPSGRMRQA